MHRMWNWKMIILKCLVITLGVFLAGLGCASYLKAALGSDPVTAFVEGLGKTLGITAGAATNILNVSAFVVLLLCNRKPVSYTHLFQRIGEGAHGAEKAISKQA